MPIPFESGVPSTDKRVAHIMRVLKSRKRTCSIGPYREGETVLTGWDGGSKDEYMVIHRGGVSHLRMEVDPDRTGDPFKQRMVLPKFPSNAVAVARVGFFCGKPATPHIMFGDVSPSPSSVEDHGCAALADCRKTFDEIKDLSIG